LAVKW